jgi:hypothetical protein
MNIKIVQLLDAVTPLRANLGNLHSIKTIQLEKLPRISQFRDNLPEDEVDLLFYSPEDNRPLDFDEEDDLSLGHILFDDYVFVISRTAVSMSDNMAHCEHCHQIMDKFQGHMELKQHYGNILETASFDSYVVCKSSACSQAGRIVPFGTVTVHQSVEAYQKSVFNLHLIE